MDKLLQVGDVFELKKGMKVVASIGSNYYDIEVGNSYYFRNTNRFKLNKELDRFLSGRKVTMDMLVAFSEFCTFLNKPHNTILKIDTLAFLGKYVVTEVRCDKFHKIIAKKLKTGVSENDTKIFFYQKEGLFESVVKPHNLCVCGKE